MGAAETHDSTCEVHELPLPQGSKRSAAVVSDPTGRWVAGHAAYDRENHLIVWHDNVPTDVDVPFYYVVPGGITADGVIAGSAANRRGGMFGFVSVDGDIIRLTSPRRSYHVTITGISRAGLISGWSMTRRDERHRAYVWDLARPDQPHRLRVPPGFANTFGTSADGHTAVTVFGSERRAFVFARNGKRTELHGTESRFEVVTVTAIANRWASGSETDPATGEMHYLRWDLRRREVETIPANFFGIHAVNRNGAVVSQEISDVPFEAAVYTDRLILLPPLLPGYEASPSDISSRHVVVGLAEARRDRLVAVRWTCEEPRPA